MDSGNMVLERYCLGCASVKGIFKLCLFELNKHLRRCYDDTENRECTASLAYVGIFLSAVWKKTFMTFPHDMPTFPKHCDRDCFPQISPLERTGSLAVLIWSTPLRKHRFLICEVAHWVEKLATCHARHNRLSFSDIQMRSELSVRFAWMTDSSWWLIILQLKGVFHEGMQTDESV